MNALIKGTLLALGALPALLSADAAQRVKTYSDAAEAAGKDGIIVYVYGPDWNTRSNRMLHEFWDTPELEQAAGNAVLLALPIYQNEANKELDNGVDIKGRLRLPGFSYCPRVVMLDEDGEIYADLHGTDDLGDIRGAEGLANIKKNLDLLRQRNAILEEADHEENEARARLLSKAADLPIKPQADIVERIRMADPHDRTGCLRRHEFNPREFLYQEMDTKDGFLKPGFTPDLNAIKHHCTRVFNDTAYKVEDRQAAYNLLIGITRQNGIVAQRLKTLIRANMRVGPETRSGKAGAHILTLWGDAKPDKNAARIRKENRAGIRRYNKEKREEQRRADKVKRNIRQN